MNIARLLERSAAVHAGRPALAFGTEIVASYAAFFAQASRLACGLRDRLGIAPGDRVAIFSANHASYLEAMYAAWIAGAVVVPINAKLHGREVAWILTNSGASACWVDDTGHIALHGLELPSVRLLDIGALSGLRADVAMPLAPRSADDVAWLFYTSGTTGRPKGVMLTHANLLQATQCFLADVLPVAAGDVLLHAAPQSHGSGFYNIGFVAAGGLNVVPASRGFAEDEVLELTGRYPGLSLFAAPTMVKRIVAAERARPGRARSLGTIVYGGGPMYLADLEDALSLVGQKFVQIYGQGEAPMTITVLPSSVIADAANPRRSQRLASVGHAQLCVEISIRGPEGDDLPCGAGGEVCVRGPVVMKGYWKDETATRDALQDGWLHTGDIGVLDADGFLTLKDRSKDVIISGGSNIYPREVEEVLLAHPRVREAGVVGMYDAEWGESVVAFVVGDGLSAGELDRLCLDHLARFKRPRHYRFVDQLPKNNYGKVLKTELRAWLADPLA
jgi:long-chain acyl-CoA synthetase